MELGRLGGGEAWRENGRAIASSHSSLGSFQVVTDHCDNSQLKQLYLKNQEVQKQSFHAHIKNHRTVRCIYLKWRYCWIYQDRNYIYSIHKYYLSAFCISGPVLSIGYMCWTNRPKSLLSWSLNSCGRRERKPNKWKKYWYVTCDKLMEEKYVEKGVGVFGWEDLSSAMGGGEEDLFWKMIG